MDGADDDTDHATRPFYRLAFTKRKPRRLVLEVAESAVLGCMEPDPISGCYEDELPRVRRAILRTRVMPWCARTLGDSFIHLNKIDYIVEVNDDILEHPQGQVS